MRIGILGGTFDPVHRGHIQLALCAQKQFDLDKVFFVPAFCSPHKIQRTALSSPEDRLQMTRLAVENHSGFDVSDFECRKGGISYTVDTLREFRRLYPNSELYLILGEDAARGLRSWKDSPEIFTLAEVAAARRSAQGGSQPVSDSFADKVLWVNMPPCPISGTEVRRRLTAGELLPKGVLDENVSAYIASKQLYSRIKL